MYSTNSEPLIGKDKITRLRGLTEKKNREKTGLMLVEGINAVEQVVRRFTELVVEVIIDEDLAETADFTAGGRADITAIRNVYAVPRKTVDAISKDAAGVFAVVKTRVEVPESSRNGAVVICNEVQDPGNAGALIRASVALGASRIIFTKGSVDHWSPKVVRSSVGAVFQIPVMSTLSITQAVEYARQLGYHIIAADVYGTETVPAKALRIVAPTLKGKQIAWVFGNEARGLTPEQIDECDECAYIPLAEGVESLNLAGAVHICLYATNALS